MSEFSSTPDSDTAPSALAKPAATVLLARDTAHGDVEIFLVQRQGSMGFMGGMHVFPGGKVSASDTTDRMLALVLDAAVAPVPWGSDVDARDALGRAVAAVRETFEEAGILLAHDTRGVSVGALRQRLLGGEDFATLLLEAGLWLRLSTLVPLSRWITPEGEPVRFDTNFYVARAPMDQTASHDLKESTAGTWLSPARALAAAEAGQIRLAPPTARSLEGLLGVSSVDAALELAARQPPSVILPILRKLGKEVVVIYPGDPEHPQRAKVLAGPTRRVLRRL